MKRLAVLLLLLLAPALAGQMACRVSAVGSQIFYACFAEETLLRLGPVELGGGVEIRSWPAAAGLTPYSFISLSLEGWWAVLQLGRGNMGWAWTISAGVYW